MFNFGRKYILRSAIELSRKIHIRGRQKKNAILGILRLALKSTLPNSDFTLYQLFLSANCIQIFPPSNQGIMYMKKKEEEERKKKKAVVEILTD